MSHPGSEVEAQARSVVSRYTHDAQDRDALMQAARIGIWQARARYDAQRRVHMAHYASATAHYYVRHELEVLRRHKDRLVSVPRDAEPPEVVDVSPGVLEGMEASEQRQGLADAMEGCSEVERYVLLRRMEGATYRGLARELECSHEWVRRLAERAIQALKDELNPEVH
jgi:RNA polymerase sigma factor (sigma-70 family)